MPNIDSIIAAVPAVLFAAVQLGHGAALWSVVGRRPSRGERRGRQYHRAAVHGARFMGRGLSALVVFLSLVFWGGGCWARSACSSRCRLTMMIKIALDLRPDTHWIAVLLGPEGAAAEELEARVSESGSGSGTGA